MARGRTKMKLKMKRKPRDSTEKKVRVLCDFCGFSSNHRDEQSPHEQAVASMESQLERLRLVTRRMTCQDLDGLSFTELILLESHLNDVLRLVQQKKMEVEEDGVQVEEDGIGTRRHVLVPCTSSSSGAEAPPPVMSKTQIAYERQSAESTEVKFQRLWLLKERMNARELDGMNSEELRLLERKITQALADLKDHRFAPLWVSVRRAPCNFCEFSTAGSEVSLPEQDNDAELRKQVERLRSLLKRITGKDDTATFTELLALETHLKDVRRIVKDQKEKMIKLEEDERLKKDTCRPGGVLLPCTSSQGKFKRHAPLLKMKRNFETRDAESESLQSEFDRLWLLNERMNGRQLQGMTSIELLCLHTNILCALNAVINQESGPRRDQMAREPETQTHCSSDNHNSPQLLLAPRKFRRFHTRYQRKTRSHSGTPE